MSTPIIGITPDRDHEARHGESQFFVRRNYCDAVADGGGLPLILPYRPELVESYLDLLDGIVLTGGMFDLHPRLYGMAARDPEHMALKEDRTAFELAILRGAMARDLPVLGICGGMQLIAVAMGARLLQHLPADVGAGVEHKQHAPCDRAGHAIHITPGSQLHRLLDTRALRVNSLHHQAVAEVNAQLRAGARAEDGVIEAIEVPGQRFCIGVQWHPEYSVNRAERGLFAGLVAAAAGQRGARRPSLSRDC